MGRLCKKDALLYSFNDLETLKSTAKSCTIRFGYEVKIHYSNIIPMHAFLKYTSVLPTEYDYNLWYRCIAAYIIGTYVDIEKLVELNKYGWNETARQESKRLVLDADIITSL
jgi:hypothetical protein